MDFDLPDLEGLDSIILQQVHATWLLPTGHPLAGAEKIAPQQLQGETLILTQEDSRGNTEELLRQYYNQLGLKGNPEFPIGKDTTPNMMNPRLYTTSYNKPQGQQFDDTAVLSFIKLQYT